MNVFPRQVRAFDKFHRSDDKLTPIVNILLIFSGTLGESVGIIVSIQSHDIPAFRTSTFLAFLSRKDNLRWHWRSWSRSIPTFLASAIFNSGSEGRYRKLRSACEPSERTVVVVLLIRRICTR